MALICLESFHDPSLEPISSTAKQQLRESNTVPDIPDHCVPEVQSLWSDIMSRKRKAVLSNEDEVRVEGPRVCVQP